MANRNKTLRPTDFSPHPDQEAAIAALLETKSGYQINPRGRVWHVSCGYEFSDKHVSLLSRFPQFTSLVKVSPFRPYANLTDEGVRQLSTIPLMTALKLENCSSITNNIFPFLSLNKRIRWLHLNCPNISDEGMECASKMTHLLMFGLIGSAVTEKSVSHLSKLINLRALFLENCDFSADAIQSLQLALPKCKIATS